MRWTEEVKDIFRPRDKPLPSVWAERNRYLGEDQSARPGPWRNSNAPYLVGIMDITTIPGITQINICKNSQGGVSDAIRSVVGCWAENEPDPIGVTLPDENKGKSIVSKRYLPLFKETKVLRELMTERKADAKREQVRLKNGFLLSLMWSGSATSMSSDPMRRVINDEVDKFQPFAGREGDPVSLTEARIRTYQSRKLQINISSPTDRFGKIWRLFEASDFLFFYYVPCPHCGTYQRLLFPQLKWDKAPSIPDKKDRARLLRNGSLSVWYECVSCGQKIDESRKDEIVQAGRWSSGQFKEPLEDGVYVDLKTIRYFPTETHIGMHLNALYCLWERWGNLAAKFIEAEGDQEATYFFRTNQLGEPFEQQINRMYSDRFSEMSQSAELQEGIVPAWAVKVLATVDTQQDHFYVVVRAWGLQMRSHRVWHGKIKSFSDLDQVAIRKLWTNENPERSALPAELVLIDTGGTRADEDMTSRTMEVYTWASLRTLRVRAIKGSSHKMEGKMYRESKVMDYSTGQGKRKRRKGDLTLWLLDSHKCHSQLAQMMNDHLESVDEKTGEVLSIPIWEINKNDDYEYNQQMANLNMVQVRKGMKTVEEWRPVASGARHDYRDCEAYQIAAAYMARIHLLSDEDVQVMTRPRPKPVAQTTTIENKQTFVNRSRLHSGSWFRGDR